MLIERGLEYPLLPQLSGRVWRCVDPRNDSFALELEKMGDQHPHMGEPSGSPCVESPTEVERRLTTE